MKQESYGDKEAADRFDMLLRTAVNMKPQHIQKRKKGKAVKPSPSGSSRANVKNARPDT
jgi:hypothetical protein